MKTSHPTHQHPLATLVLDELVAQMPFLWRAAHNSQPPLAQRLDRLEWLCARLERIRGDARDWMPQAVKAYVMLSMEFLLLQRKLEKTGHYLHATEQETFAKIYNNPEVFDTYYLDGLLLSEVLWPNHFVLNELFTAVFLPLIQTGWHVVEGGVGTGYHLRQLLEKISQVNYTGIDVSDLAIDYCRRFVGEDLLPKDGSGSTIFLKGNIAKVNELASGMADALILGEILEHVEDPSAVLLEMRRVAKPDACMFSTTAIFAANVDHIYLFEKVEDVRQMITACHWGITHERIIPIYPTDSANQAKRPISYGAILRAC